MIFESRWVSETQRESPKMLPAHDVRDSLKTIIENKTGAWESQTPLWFNPQITTRAHKRSFTGTMLYGLAAPPNGKPTAIEFILIAVILVVFRVVFVI